MLRRLIILNCALLALLIAGGMRFYRDWMAFEPAHQVAAIQAAPETFPAAPLASASAPAEASDWTEVSSRNPFSFDRTDIPVLAVQVSASELGPKPVLFGVMALGGPRLAMLAPGRPAGNRNYKPMKPGEVIDGWTIVQVDAKSVLVESNGVRETILMNDPTAQVPREYTRTVTAAPAPVVIQPTATSTTSASPTNSSAAGNAPTAASATGQPRYRTIQTPFGTVRQLIEEDPQ